MSMRDSAAGGGEVVSDEVDDGADVGLSQRVVSKVRPRLWVKIGVVVMNDSLLFPWRR